MTDWQLERISDFEWAEPGPGITREDWVAADGGFWVYPAAGTDREPVWISDQQADASIKGYVLGTLSAILGVVPYVGKLKDLIQFFVGRDIVTGEKLSWFERAINLAGLFEGALKPVADVAGDVVKDVHDLAHLTDVVLDCQQVFESQMGTTDDVVRLAELSGRLDDGLEQLRQGAQLDDLPWTEQTTAVLNAGMYEAQRLTEKLAASHPMTSDQAAQVREILLKAYVRQAQVDGLLPARLEVVPSAAEGGSATETVDVRDPMTGTSWDVSDPLGDGTGRVVAQAAS